MPLHAYASVDELKDFLCLTDEDRDYALDLIVEAASRLIDDWTGHQFFTQANQTRYYTWRPGSDVMALKIDDVLTVTSLLTDSNGDGVYETTWNTTTDYYLEPINAPAHDKPYTTLHRKSFSGRFWFPSYLNSVSVTGTFGYSLTVPKGVKRLCLMVSELMARPLLDMSIPGVESFKLGPDINVTASPLELPPLGQMLLAQYAEPTFVVL